MTFHMDTINVILSEAQASVHLFAIDEHFLASPRASHSRKIARKNRVVGPKSNPKAENETKRAKGDLLM